jgi:hypothetical protein
MKECPMFRNKKIVRSIYCDGTNTKEKHKRILVRESISKYLLATPIFTKLISRNRFEQITKYLHFNDNMKMNANSESLYKIESVYNSLIGKF